MQLKQLKAFVAVAKEKSFSQAAASTHLSQPTLSRLIRQLEDDLGVELFDRYHRPLELTEAGAFFYQKVMHLLQQLETATQLTQQIAKPSPSLRIGFVPSILYGLLPDIIALLKQTHPTLDIHLKEISSYQQINALKLGEIDVGFGRFAHQDLSIKQILLRHERYVVALPVQHPLLSSKLHSPEALSLRLSDLMADTLILYHQTHLPKTEATTITEPLLNLFAQHGLYPQKTTAVSDLQVALGLVVAGEGMTLVPESLKTVRTAQVAYVRLLHENVTSPIYLHTLSDAPNSEVIALLDATYAIYEERGVTYRRQSLS